MGHRPQTVHLRRGRASLSPINAEQTSYDSPAEKKKCLGGEKGSFISLLQTLAARFIKLSPVKYIPPSQAKAHRGQEASEASY